MKFILFTIFISLLIFSSCKKSENNPVEPEPEIKYMFLEGYGSLIDSFYYKQWSDSSWEKFNRVTTINGRTYVTIINNEGAEYYYDVIGYAGFKPSGESLILFDHTLPPIPDSIVFNQTYTRETTFYYQGYNYTLKFEQSLTDTVSVSVPFGIFNSCLWFKSKAVLSASGQSETQNGQFWLAKGPSDIKQTLNSGITIVMVRGIVNGQGWGMSFPKISTISNKNNVSNIFNSFALPLFKNVKIKLNIN